MPPKNKKKSNLSVDAGSPTNESEKAGMELAGVSSELEHFLDQHLNQQSEKIDALLSKYTNMTKSDIAEVKKTLCRNLYS